MKKMIAACAAMLMIASLVAGCASAPAQEREPIQIAEQTAAPEATQPTAAPSAEAPVSAQPVSEDATGKALVVYYSATGNTEAVANAIAQAAGADAFELVPAQPYTDDDLNWRDDNSRCSLEYADPSARNVELAAATVDNWADYDTVFVGYPIWWGIAAWPVDTFVKANDFSGKTVIPFCTSSSSGLGESGELLADMAGTGDWQAGFRFRSGASIEDVQAWVTELGF